MTPSPDDGLSQQRVTVLQAAGDYAQAYENLAAGGEPTYYAQRYSVDTVGQLARRVASLRFIVVGTDRKYEKTLVNGVTAVGMGMAGGAWDPRAILSELARGEPTRVALTTPFEPALRWVARQRGVEAVTVLADSFRTDPAGRLNRPGLRWLGRRHGRRRVARLVEHLNSDALRWVGNHNLAATRGLATLGVRPDKLVPWDWPAVVTPDDHPARARPRGDGPARIVFVGVLSEAKGVGDLVDAVALLHRRGVSITLCAIGGGDAAWLRRRAVEHGIDGLVTLPGRLPHGEVVQRLRDAEVVVVPSRHSYPEGLPMTIYESLSVRTPLVISDHPMFTARLRDGEAALVFPEKRPEALADRVASLLSDHALYARLSEASAAVWRSLQIPVTYGDVLVRGLSDASADRAWLAERSLASGRYDDAPR